MESININEILAQQEKERIEILEKSNRAHSALALAKMALEHSGGGSHAAAKLLLSMQHGTDFDFQLLLKFDTTNRAHADLVMMGYRAHEIWPSSWLDDIGENGADIMNKLSTKWAENS